MNKVAIRTFVGVRIPENSLVGELVKVYKRKYLSKGIRFTDTSSLHLTMFFLGATDYDLLPSICKKLSEIAENATSFEIGLSGTGYFNVGRGKRVYWIGLEQVDQLALLQGMIQLELRQFGFNTPDESFKPHVTICKLSKKDFKWYNDFNDDFLNVSFGLEMIEIELFELTRSVLASEGPRYETIETFRLSSPESPI